MVRYSLTPLAKKLGIKNGFVMMLINEPDYYFSLFNDIPVETYITVDGKTKKDFIHCFIKEKTFLLQNINAIKQQLKPAGIIWVSWYKKAAKIPTDVTEDIIRDIALANGLVDIKVCAIDELWSGLKLVIPLKNRTAVV